MLGYYIIPIKYTVFQYKLQYPYIKYLIPTKCVIFPYRMQYLHVRYSSPIYAAVFPCYVHYPVRLLHISKIQYAHNVVLSFEHIFIATPQTPYKKNSVTLVL